MAVHTTSLLFILAMVAVMGKSFSWDSASQWGLTHLAAPVIGDHGILDMPKKCNGRFGDCVDDEEEMMMESEISRRGLAGRQRFISYDALKHDRIPCSRRGQSYYNCRRSNRVNPYRRGCSVITRCYRFTK